MKTTVLTFLTLLLLLSNAFAQEYEDWFLKALKKENPDELGYYLVASPNCPFKEKEAKKQIEGAFTKNRIEPLKDEYTLEKLYLSVAINCGKTGADSFLYIVDYGFGRRLPRPAVIFDNEAPSIWFGIGKKQTILNILATSAEEILVPYIKANSDE
jgi:hypothetical protein